MTVTNKLWSHRGEHGISRKPSRREGRSVSAEPVCSCAFFYLPLHMRPRVQRAPGLPCVPLGIALRPSWDRPASLLGSPCVPLGMALRPLSFGGQTNFKTSGEGRAEIAG